MPSRNKKKKGKNKYNMREREIVVDLTWNKTGSDQLLFCLV
jgi:hypothetical protein